MVSNWYQNWCDYNLKSKRKINLYFYKLFLKIVKK
nr:MAG TPA: hypothetical protein [Caudoviricetes sp.]